MTGDVPGEANSITVIIVSYNRGRQACRAVDSVLTGTHRAVSVIVVDVSDDGATPDLLRGIEDDRVTLLFAPNFGQSIARNVGLTQVRTPWVGFLDDDDILVETWAEDLLAAASDRSGLVIGTTEYVNARTGATSTWQARPGWPVPSGFVSGAFIARADVIRSVGGLLEGLPMAHHWELAVRLGAWCAEHDLTIDFTPRTVAQIDERDIGERVQYSTMLTHQGKRWVNSRHLQRLEQHPEALRTQAINIGVAAFRLGRRAEARRWLLFAIRVGPSWESLGRLAVMLAPPIGRRVWGDAAGEPRATSGPRRGLRVLPDLVMLHGPRADLHLLPYGYVERDAPPADEPLDHLERHAVEVARAEAARTLRRRRRSKETAAGIVATAEHDHELTVTIDGVRRPLADAAKQVDIGVLVIGGLLDRVPDPHGVLVSARTALAPGTHVVVTSVDRAVADGRFHLGPPTSPGARRRWTAEELELVLQAADLTVLRMRPRIPEITTRPHGDGAIVATCTVPDLPYP